MIKEKERKKEKLLRIRAKVEKDIIKEIKISGDFFIYPEEGIGEIEKKLRNKNIKNIRPFNIKGIETLGVTIEDIVNTLKDEYKKTIQNTKSQIQKSYKKPKKAKKAKPKKRKKEITNKNMDP